MMSLNGESLLVLKWYNDPNSTINSHDIKRCVYICGWCNYMEIG